MTRPDDIEVVSSADLPSFSGPAYQEFDGVVADWQRLG
jgi:hypothetical protein